MSDIAGNFWTHLSGREEPGPCVFSVPANDASVSKTAGLSDPRSACDLGRLVIDPSQGGNAETYLVSRAFRLLRREKPEILSVISYAERIAGEPMILLPGNSPDMEQSIGRVLARGRPLGAVPVRPLDAFVGYGWYDDLPRVTDLAFQVALNGEVFDHHGGIELLPGRESGPIDAISLEVVVQRSAHPDANVEQLSLHADLLIALASGWGDVGEARVLFTPDCSIDASDLAWLLTDACFCPSDDCEADSYQTQRDVAETEARFIATNLLHGEDAALIERVRSATLA